MLPVVLIYSYESSALALAKSRTGIILRGVEDWGSTEKNS